MLLNAHFDSLTPDRRVELLGVLRSSTTRLSSIFEDILLLSRMDAGKLTLRYEEVDPAMVAAESITRMKNEHPERTFEVSAPATIPKVRADEGRVVQILVNLLSNAAKYSFRDTPIRVEMKNDERCVTFSVKNAGVGIADADRERVFTRFGRAGTTDDSIGLGLYISSELVSLMGGSIGFESELNKLTTFHFSLPIAEIAPATA